MIDIEVLSTDEARAYIPGHVHILPICSIPGTDLNIFAFDSMGDTQLISAVAMQMVTAYDMSDAVAIICPEAKAIPIAQRMARMLNIDYFVLRKNKKLYMKTPEKLEVESITTKGKQELWYDEAEAEKLRFHKVILFDDVVSTGSSFKALEDFAKRYDMDVILKTTVFLEGDSQGRTDIKALGKLPILSKKELTNLVGCTL